MESQASALRYNESIKIQFVAEVELGVPSKKCKNFGICRIFPRSRFLIQEEQDASIQLDDCPHKKLLEGVVTVLQNDQVEICFLRNFIDELTLHNHFGSGKFKVEEDFHFSKAGTTKVNFVIKKGVYKIKMNQSLVTILFVK